MHILQQSDGGGQKSQVSADSNVCGTRSARGRSRVRLAMQNREQQLCICTRKESLIEADDVLLRRAMTPRYPEGDFGVNR